MQRAEKSARSGKFCVAPTVCYSDILNAAVGHVSPIAWRSSMAAGPFVTEFDSIGLTADRKFDENSRQSRRFPNYMGIAVVDLTVGCCSSAVRN